MSNIFFEDSDLQNLQPVRKTQFEFENHREGDYNYSYKSIRPEHHILIEASLDRKAADEVAENLFIESDNFEKANSNLEPRNDLNLILNSLTHDFSSNADNKKFFIFQNYGQKFIFRDDQKKYEDLDEVTINVDNKNIYIKDGDAQSVEYISYFSHSIHVSCDNVYQIKSPFNAHIISINENRGNKKIVLKHLTSNFYIEYNISSTAAKFTKSQGNNLNAEEIFCESINQNEIVLKRTYVLDNNVRKYYFSPRRGNIIDFEDEVSNSTQYRLKNSQYSTDSTVSIVNTSINKTLINSTLPQQSFKLYKMISSSTSANIRQFISSENSGYIFKKDFLDETSIKSIGNFKYHHIKTKPITSTDVVSTISFTNEIFFEKNDCSMNFVKDNVDEVFIVYFPLNFKLDTSSSNYFLKKDDSFYSVLSDDGKNTLFSIFNTNVSFKKYLKFKINKDDFLKNVLSDLKIIFNKQETTFKLEKLKEISLDNLDLTKHFSVVDLKIHESLMQDEDLRDFKSLKYDFLILNKEKLNSRTIPIVTVNYSYIFKNNKIVICFNHNENPNINITQPNLDTEKVFNDFLGNFNISLSRNYFNYPFCRPYDQIPDSFFNSKTGLEFENINFIEYVNMNSIHVAGTQNVGPLNFDISIVPNPIIVSSFLKFPMFSKYFPTNIYEAVTKTSFQYNTGSNDSMNLYNSLKSVYDKLYIQNNGNVSFDAFSALVEKTNNVEINLVEKGTGDDTENYEHSKNFAIKQYIEIDLKELYKEIVTNMINVEAFNFDETV